MKKTIKILLGIIVVFILALVLIPIIFQDKIIAVLKEKINENVNAKVEFSDANLSLIRNFPKASVQLKDVAVINFEPFKGDTLFYGKEINLKISLTDVIKPNQINIQSFDMEKATVNVLINEKGQTNYDIAKESTTTKEKSESESKQSKLSINSYQITNSTINYIDKKGKMEANLTNFNHSGKGDFSADRTNLDTNTDTDISFLMGGKAYAEKLHLDLKALLDLDLANKKFSFLKNEAHINQLPLIFDGFVKVNENNQDVNITFKTPSSDFKNFLGIVPKAYAKNIADVKTSGNFSITGNVTGIVDDTHIPKFDILIKSNNASFKYPDLPKSVNNIHINTSIKNTTGLVKNTLVNINNLSFRIDDNTFTGNGTIKQLTTNPLVNVSAKGKLNLAHIDKVYPIDMKNKLSGLIIADITSSFDMDAIKKNIYQRIDNKGTISINDFIYASPDVKNPINIATAKVDFASDKITLTKFEAKTGTSDLTANGNIDGLLGFLLANKNLKGQFNLTSNDFKLNDFMSDASTTSTDKKEKPTSTEETLKIPEFLDCTVNANAKKVYYDNLVLQNVKGSLRLKDGKAILNDVNANLFGGTIGLNGLVDTKKKKPSFDMKLAINSFNISDSFKNMAMLQSLAPIAEVVQGKLNTSIDLKGILNNDLSPNLNSIAGKAFAQVLSPKLNPEKSTSMKLLNNKLSFIDFNKLNLKDVKTHLSFDNGKVNVKPFNIKYKDIDMAVGGSHGFDKSMNYKVALNIPAKYLGTEVSNLLAKADAKNKNKTVPVTANLTGSFTNPAVSTDLKSAVTSLTKDLINQQKNKLIDNTISNLLGGKKKTKDSTDNTKKTKDVKKDVKDKVNGILKGFLGGK